MNTLKTAGKTKYECEGVGLVNVITKFNWTTPKTNDEKLKLFKYIENTYSDDVLLTMTSINYQTLNSWAKSEMEIHEKDPTFSIPGLAEPTSAEVLSFRSKR